jgi:hypothetical protein
MIVQMFLDLPICIDLPGTLITFLVFLSWQPIHFVVFVEGSGLYAVGSRFWWSIRARLQLDRGQDVVVDVL